MRTYCRPPVRHARSAGTRGMTIAVDVGTTRPLCRAAGSAEVSVPEVCGYGRQPGLKTAQYECGSPAMSARTQQKLSPLDTWSLRGTDRRGANASLTAASATGITITGHFSDEADFTVPLIFKRDDLYGYLGTGGTGASRYLPSGSLAGVVLDTDVAIAGAFSPLSEILLIGAGSAQLHHRSGASPARNRWRSSSLARPAERSHLSQSQSAVLWSSGTILYRLPRQLPGAVSS